MLTNKIVSFSSLWFSDLCVKIELAKINNGLEGDTALFLFYFFLFTQVIESTNA